jgi:hypothetical protein
MSIIAKTYRDIQSAFTQAYREAGLSFPSESAFLRTLRIRHVEHCIGGTANSIDVAITNRGTTQ